MNVKISTQDAVYEGFLVQEDGEYVVLKLSSGYNVGIRKDSITSQEELSSEPTLTPDFPAIPFNDQLQTVHIIHTGGTIASKIDYKTGGVFADFTPERLVALFPELNDLANITTTFVGNMFSDDFRFAHFNKIITAIQEAMDAGVKKIIVTSGTDFLHYLSAGLSFICKDADVSLLVVGSQRSSDRPSSDAGMNLICATTFLMKTDFTGVGVCMHETTNDDSCIILPGVNIRKMHSSRRDAFKALNTKPLASVDYLTKEVTLHQPVSSSASKSNKPLGRFNEELKIGMLLSHPNMFAQEIEHFSSFDGVVVLGSGLGHLPASVIDEHTTEHGVIYSVLLTLAKNIPVVMSTQCLYGQTHLQVYSQGRRLQELGIYGHESFMSPETTYMKLAYLLSTNQDLSLLETNMCGEQNSERWNDEY